MVTTQTPVVRRLIPLDAGTRLEDLLSSTYEYRGWEDVDRDKWTWDKVVHVGHPPVNRDSTCSPQAYVRARSVLPDG